MWDIPCNANVVDILISNLYLLNNKKRFFFSLEGVLFQK
jgi:hypothetical protein